jgi:hypothetical protein
MYFLDGKEIEGKISYLMKHENDNLCIEKEIFWGLIFSILKLINAFS